MARYEHLRNVIGPALKKHRIARELSQSELATKCQLLGWDISRDIVASIEGRGRIVADYELILLASILEIPLKAFFPKEIAWKASGVPHFPSGVGRGAEVELGISLKGGQGDRPPRKGHNA